jgi:hypothetical protein
MGEPFCDVIVLANSWLRPWISWLSLAIFSARSAAVVRGHGPRSNALRAAATARSMSAFDPSGTRAITSSVDGEMTSIWFELAGSAHCPSMKSLSLVIMSILPWRLFASH